MSASRTFSFIALVISALFLPLWAFALASVVYAFVFSPYEVLFVAVCIDAEFGKSTEGMPYLYTTIASCILVFSFLTRPYLRFYR